MHQPPRVSVWVAILALANLASIVFWAAPVAKMIFVTFILSITAMMVLYSFFGFQKFLGIAHVFWIYLVPFIVLQLEYANGIFLAYLSTLVVLLTVSLVLDAIDIWKYFREMRIE